MPLTNYPFGVASFGQPVLPSSSTQTSTGNVWFVQSGTSSPINDATSPQTPAKTLLAAINFATASNGDIIYVMPGHVETIANATALTLNKAGIRVIGLGYGSLRPTFTFTTATTANIPVTAANIIVSNILFRSNFADVASFFTATGTATPTDFWVDNCEFRDVDATHNALTVFTGNATANSCDGLTLTNNRIQSKATTALTTAVKLTSATDRMSVRDTYGVWAALNDTPCLLDAAANALTNFEMARNILYRPSTSSSNGIAVNCTSTACTGHCYDNYVWHLDNTAAIWITTATKLGFSQNFSMVTGAADKSGLINPVAV